MKINFQNQKEIESELLRKAIENHFKQKSQELQIFTYSRDFSISNKTFDKYEIEKIKNEGRFVIFSAMLIKDLQEFPFYKKIYLKNLDLVREYFDKNSIIQHCDCLPEMNFVEKVLKFLKPIIAKELEKELERINFFQKSIWLEQFKKDFAPLIKLFENPEKWLITTF